MMSLPGLGRETLEWDIRFPYIEGSESLDSLLFIFSGRFFVERQGYNCYPVLGFEADRKAANLFAICAGFFQICISFAFPHLSILVPVFCCCFGLKARGPSHIILDNSHGAMNSDIITKYF